MLKIQADFLKIPLSNDLTQSLMSHKMAETVERAVTSQIRGGPMKSINKMFANLKQKSKF